MQDGLEGRFIEVNGRQLHYHDVGEGEPTLLIHGGGPGAGGLSNYRRNVESLAKSRRVLVIDLPGYGKSDNQPATAPLFEMMADVVKKFFDALGIEKASLVGNSLGGGTSLLYALDNPERVNRLVLMGAAGTFPVFSPAPTEGLFRMLNFYNGEAPSIAKLRHVIDLLVFDPSAITDELLEERLVVASRPDVVSNFALSMRVPGKAGASGGEIWRRLPEVSQRTLIIWGREDRVLTLDSAFPLLRLIPNAQLHVFPNCGHWAQWEKAAEFNQLVANFLDAD